MKLFWKIWGGLLRISEHCQLLERLARFIYLRIDRRQERPCDADRDEPHHVRHLELT